MSEQRSPSDVLKQFSKSDLLEIVDVLEIDMPNRSATAFDIVALIRKDLDANGVPEPEDAQEIPLLVEYLRYEGYYTPDMQIAEGSPEPQEDEEGPETEEPDIPEKPPECYGLADPDGARVCTQCRILQACLQERAEVIGAMECYGVLCDNSAPECKDCALWRLCKETQEGK